MSEFRTIVGGRSRSNRLAGEFPRGIEILLKKARVDAAFRARLLKDPLSAAASISLELSRQEIHIIDSTPQSLLQAMISNTHVPKQHVNTFRTAKTAAILALILGSTVVVPPLAAAGAGAMPSASTEQIELVRQRMAAVQDALEAFRLDNGRYPSNEEWTATSGPLTDYLSVSDLYDPWERKLHYQAIKEGETIVNYRLESLGLDAESTEDNIPCPIAPEDHRFNEESGI